MLGQLLDGRYKVIQVLGAGGFGQTFVAEDTRTFDSKCVVKQLKPASSDPNFLETARRMFQVEAKTLELLGKKHAQIPQLLAYFEQDQEFYLVQEYIEGQTLSTELCPGKKWTEDQVIGLLREILNILAFVHQSGVIHRDVKPDNIIRRQADNKFVLVDFGAVKQIRTQTTTGQGLMSATIAIGTPGYMPSEQGIGKPKPSSDIYALGVIAIQALTGLNPSPDLEDTKTGFRYDQNTGEVIWQDKVQASPGLAAVLTKMVKPHFPHRYASAPEALQALEQLKFGYTPTVSANPQGYTPTVPHSPANSNTVLSNSNNLHAQTVTANQAAMPTVAQSSRDSGSKGLVILGGGLASLAVAIGMVFIVTRTGETTNDKTDPDPEPSPIETSSPIATPSPIVTPSPITTNNQAALKDEARARAAAEKKSEDEARARAAAEKKSEDEARARVALEKKLEDEARARAALEKKLEDEARARAALEKKLEDIEQNLTQAITSQPSTASSLPIEEQGFLSSDSFTLDDSSYYQEHIFQGNAGEMVTISLGSEEFDTYLILLDPNRQVIGENDDMSDESLNSQLTITLPETGVYRVIANSYEPGVQGNYNLSVH